MENLVGFVLFSLLFCEKISSIWFIHSFCFSSFLPICRSTEFEGAGFASAPSLLFQGRSDFALLLFLLHMLFAV